MLAVAGSASAVPRAGAALLLAEGREAEPEGGELEPPKLIVSAPAGRVARFASARPMPVRLSAEFLEAECVVLTRFETTT